MLRNTANLTLKIVGVLIVGIVLAMLALLWRLTTGPVSLDFARDFLEQSLTPTNAGITVEIGKPVLSWVGWDRVFDVTVNDVLLLGKDDSFVVRAPSVHFRLSAAALADGLAVPVRIVVDRPDIQLGTRFARTGDFDSFSEDLANYLTPTALGNRLKHLTLVEIIGGTLTLAKPLPMGVVRLKELDATLNRGSRSLRTSGSAHAVISGHPVRLTADLLYDGKDRGITGTASVAGLPGSALNGVLAKTHADMALTGVIDAGVEVDFTIQKPAHLLRASMSISVAGGTLLAPGLVTSAIVFDTLYAEALYDAVRAKLDITPIKIAKDKVVATASVAMREIFDEPEVTISAQTQNVPVDQLDTYWPAGAGDLARNWILKNLEHGIAKSAHFEATGSISAKKSWTGFSLASLSGDIEFSGVTTHFLRPLRPATGTSGRAKFTDDQFDIIINSSKIDNLVFDGSKVRFFDLDTDIEKAEIDLIARGPLKTALRLLDHESLSLVRRIDLDTAAIAGFSESRVRLTFPMARSLTLDDVEIDASANLDNVSLADLAFGQPLSGGHLTVDLNRKRMRVSGTGRLGGIPATLKLKEVFDSNSPIRGSKKIKGQIEQTAIEALKLPKSIGVEGSVEVEADVVKYADGHSEVSAVIDLANAAISVPTIRWLKPIGSAGRIRFDLALKHERVTALRSASVVAADLGADLGAVFDPSTGNLSRIILNRLILGDSEMKGVINRKGHNSYHAELFGPRLNLRRFMDRDHEGPPQPGPDFKVSALFDEILIGVLPPIRQTKVTFSHSGSLLADIQLDQGWVGEERINADLRAVFDPSTGNLSRIILNRLILGDSEMKGVINRKGHNSYHAELFGPRLNLRRFMDRDHEELAEFGRIFEFKGSARFEELQLGFLPPIRQTEMTFSHDGARFDVKLDQGRIGEKSVLGEYEAKDGTSKFKFGYGNAGQVLGGFDMLGKIIGGRLTATGLTTGAGLTRNTTIELKVDEFRLVNAPVLARLLNAAFLPALVDLLGGKEGIRFKKLNAEIKLSDGKVEIVDALAVGTSLGISTQGEIDHLDQKVNVYGMIVPQYWLSQLIDEIGFLGLSKFITGGKKEGLLATEYLIKGKLKKPQVIVNPLTALTPGFLRALVKAAGSSPPVEKDQKQTDTISR